MDSVRSAVEGSQEKPFNKSGFINKLYSPIVKIVFVTKKTFKSFDAVCFDKW